MREVAVMSLSAVSEPSTGNASHMDCGRVAVQADANPPRREVVSETNTANQD